MAEGIGSVLMSWVQSQSSTTLLFMVVICGFITLLVKDYVIPYRTILATGLKGPIPKPFIGNVFDYGGVCQHRGQLKRQEKYGKIYTLLHYHIPTVYIGDPEIIKTIMVKEFSNFTNRFPVNKAHHPFDKTVVRADDDDWKRLRTLLIPSFSASKLKTNVPFINNFTNDVIDKFLQAEHQGKSVDVWKIFGNLSMSTIIATVFGIEFKSKKHKEKVITAASALLRNQTNLLQLVLIYAYLALALWEPITGGKIITSVYYLRDTIVGVIQERRKNLKRGIPCRRDILQHMIEAGDRDRLSNEEIVSQAIIFLVAGYETTASTLAFLCYTLAVNPDVQQKLIHEIDSKCPDEETLNYETVLDLPYLEMVVNETLRLYSPAFFITRQAKRDINVHEVFIPKNSMVVFPIYAVHHNPELWPDADKFIPERFSSEKKARRHPYSYIPFGGGPRICIGMKLALLEVKLALVKILHRVEFVTCKETKIPLKLRTGSTASPESSVYLKTRRRH
ncbi:Cytochrome P450 3A21 [Trichoplax sp. H2]|nr:Cytochrome P450 3A21 [Trichoplax sp. H2]|eukprot:RDD39457.1 Cytochrome P450 3A21 [Trichoplax sp. H2]